jgi:uncharacterized integral membrane protein
MVSLQNTEAVETKFLLATVTMPRVLLLLLTFTLGLVAGLITASTILRKPAKSKEVTPHSSARVSWRKQGDVSGLNVFS